MMVMWMAALSHLRGHESFSVIVKTFAQIISDMRGFLAIVILLWLGGTMAFKVLLPGHPEFRNAHGLVAVWRMLMGDPMMDDLDVEANSRTVFGIISKDHALETTVFAKCLSMSFVFIVVVVLMNQLIALMSESYRKVMSNLRVENVRARARLIVSLIELYTTRGDIIEPKWLHVLRPKPDAENNVAANSATSGHRNAAQFKAVGERIAGLQEMMGNLGQSVEKTKLSVLQDISESQAKINKVKNKVDRLTDVMEDLLSRLGQNKEDAELEWAAAEGAVGASGAAGAARASGSNRQVKAGTPDEAFAVSRLQSHLNHEQELQKHTESRQKRAKRKTQLRVEARNKLINSKKMKEVEIFKALKDEEITTLVECMHLNVFKRGENIVKQGETATSFYIIIGGECSVWRRPMDGKDVDNEEYLGDKVADLEAFQHFGESALLGCQSTEPDEPGYRNSTVRAASPEVKVFCLNSGMLRSMMTKGVINSEIIINGIEAVKRRREKEEEEEEEEEAKKGC